MFGRCWEWNGSATRAVVVMVLPTVLVCLALVLVVVCRFLVASCRPGGLDGSRLTLPPCLLPGSSSSPCSPSPVVFSASVWVGWGWWWCAWLALGDGFTMLVLG